MKESAWSPVSVIVVSYNSVPFLPSCLDSVLQSDYPGLEVIVVDNQSTDESCNLVRTRYPNVRLVRNSRNLGYGDGANLGMKYARGEYFLLLNQDVILDKSCITNLVSAASKNPRVAIAGCKVLRADRRNVLNYAWGTFGVSGRLKAPPFGKTYGHSDDLDSPNWGVVKEVGWVLGGAALVSRGAVQDMQIFDTLYFLYLEDLDLCYRALKAGRIVLNVGSAVVYRTKHSPARNPYSRERGRLIFVFKNLTLLELLLWGRQEFTNVYMRLAHGSVREEVLPLFRAYWSLIRKIPAIYLRRVQQSKYGAGFVTWRGIPDSPI